MRRPGPAAGASRSPPALAPRRPSRYIITATGPVSARPAGSRARPPPSEAPALPVISRSLAIGAAAAAAVLGLRSMAGLGHPAASVAATTPAVHAADAAPAPAPSVQPPPAPGPATRLEMARYLTSEGMASLLEETRGPITDGDGLPVAATPARAHDAAALLRLSGEGPLLQR